jgi:hypothetical protein
VSHPNILPPPPWPEPAVTGLVEVTDEPIDFTPVPRQRKRRDGWTELAQRAFIAAQNPPRFRALNSARPRLARTRALSSKLSKLPAPGARHGWGRTKNLFGRGHGRPLTMPLPQGERCDPNCVTRDKPDVTSITAPLRIGCRPALPISSRCLAIAPQSLTCARWVEATPPRSRSRAIAGRRPPP